jgi:nanoRNase/pAp phosphatase (c-di-AMP/oligoRNAs hydrolase)
MAASQMMTNARKSQERLEELFKAMDSVDSLLIFTHNSPDPDAIASAVALRFLLAEELGVESHITYEGIIGRAENKTLARCLGHPMRHLSDVDRDETMPIGLVDTQPGAGNNALSADSVVALVIDHHPWREATGMAGFIDVRVDVGATSTILTEYLQAADLEPPPLLATALFYGIKTDTRGLGRTNTSAIDVEAYFYLQSRLDIEILAEIEHAQVSADYFRGFDAALRAAHTYDGVVLAYIGKMEYPDLTAETADFLLRLEGAQLVICMNLSVRTRSWQGEAGQLAQAIVGSDGIAGGHGAMAGGQVLLRGRDPAQVAQQLGQRALQFLKVAPEVVGGPLV